MTLIQHARIKGVKESFPTCPEQRCAELVFPALNHQIRKLRPRYTEKQQLRCNTHYVVCLIPSKFLINNSILKKQETPNCSLWLLTCLTDDVTSHQSDHSPDYSDCVFSPTDAGDHASQLNSIYYSAQWLLWPSHPAQWHSDHGYEARSQLRTQLASIARKKALHCPLGMEDFKKREENCCGGKQTKQWCCISAQGCGGGGEGSRVEATAS